MLVLKVFFFFYKNNFHIKHNVGVCGGFFFQNVPLVFLEKIVPKNVTLHARGVTL